VAAVFITHLFVNKDCNWAHTVPQSSPLTRVVVYASLITLLVFLGATNAVPFIYFQF